MTAGAADVEVRVVPVGAAEREVLARLPELCVHDLGAAFEVDIGASGAALAHDRKGY